MTQTLDLAGLYRARAKTVDFVDVPELGFVVVDGIGSPTGPEFGEAVQALYGVSYAVHFLLRRDDAPAPRVMPLEALWWVSDADDRQWQSVPREKWRWRALIAQPASVSRELVDAAVVATRSKHPGGALDRLRWLRWAEGPAAQVLHVGPYTDEPATLERLHAAIAAHGLRPRGHHHEIYLSDPRRSAPERLRTILRQPVEPR